MYFLCVFTLFLAYFGQPDNQMGWATSMLFASINPISIPNPWHFCKIILRSCGAGKWHFFGFGLLGFSKKNCCFFPMKISLAFIWGIIYSCTIDGFFRILEKTSSELICIRLYIFFEIFRPKLDALEWYLNDEFYFK